MTARPAPSATVVVPSWNSAATLPAALASVDEPDAEILVVDDRSDDQAALAACIAEDSRATLVAKPERTNAAHSRALGLARARADLVLFLDSDDRFLPGHIRRRRALHGETGAGVVLGRFRLCDGVRSWTGPMAPYPGGSVEDYIFAGGGDARSSTLSVMKSALHGTSFDPSLAKHQDWGFALAADRNGERIAFDGEPGVEIGIAGPARMSARSNIEASLAFARDHLRGDGNRRRFLIGRIRTSVRLGDARAAAAFRGALLALGPSGRERWESAAMLLAGRLGVAAPLHRLMVRR